MTNTVLAAGHIAAYKREKVSSLRELTFHSTNMPSSSEPQLQNSHRSVFPRVTDHQKIAYNFRARMDLKDHLVQCSHFTDKKS